MQADNAATDVPATKSPKVLRQRIVTALVALVVFGVVLFVVPVTVARLAIALLLLAGAWEWGGLIPNPTTIKRLIYATTVGVVIAAIASALPNNELLDLVFTLALVWWSTALIWLFFFPTRIAIPVVWICGLLILVPAWAALDYLYLTNPELLIFALLIVWVADIGAYFVGKGFGRVKLAPSISPGKSWEGVMGGITAVVLLASIANRFLGSQISVLVPLCVAVALLSIVGDLTVSMFKRNAGVKDSGSLFPGHGGVMDRIDSVSAATPLFVLALGWAGIQ